jgi:hypothetical protein
MQPRVTEDGFAILGDEGTLERRRMTSVRALAGGSGASLTFCTSLPCLLASGQRYLGARFVGEQGFRSDIARDPLDRHVPCLRFLCVK